MEQIWSRMPSPEAMDRSKTLEEMARAAFQEQYRRAAEISRIISEAERRRFMESRPIGSRFSTCEPW